MPSMEIQMNFDKQMELALNLYRAGIPPLLKGNDGRVIHGEETPESRPIDGIDIEKWKGSQWPELLRGAREGWLKNKRA